MFRQVHKYVDLTFGETISTCSSLQFPEADVFEELQNFHSGLYPKGWGGWWTCGSVPDHKARPGLTRLEDAENQTTSKSTKLSKIQIHETINYHSQKSKSTKLSNKVHQPAKAPSFCLEFGCGLLLFFESCDVGSPCPKLPPYRQVLLMPLPSLGTPHTSLRRP